MSPKLTITDHSRDIAGLKYVYPVISRRAGGLSIGLNFNTNNACNWRCIYCQVPGLIKGSAPTINLALLKQELSGFLQTVLHGNFYDIYQISEHQRLIKDISISGNGEPTTAANLAQAITIIGAVVEQAQIIEPINTVLITNGSLMHQLKVKQSLKRLKQQGGQVWFKLDSATQEGRLRFNKIILNTERVIDNLITSTTLCPTWLQTCVLSMQGQGITVAESNAYLELLLRIKKQAVIKGVLLYTMARPSHQLEAKQIKPLSKPALDAFSVEIKRLGYEVKISY